MDESGQIIAVDLAQTDVSDADLDALLHFPQLRELNLRETLVSDAGLEAITSLAEVEFLGLTGTLVTDTGLEHIARFPQLRFLALGHTIVSDAGLDSLHACRRLEALNLNGTAVTEEGVSRLQRAIPNCRIISDVASTSEDPSDADKEAKTLNEGPAVSFPAGREERFGIPMPPGAGPARPDISPNGSNADPFRAAPADAALRPAAQQGGFSSVDAPDAHQRLMLVLRDKLEDPDVLRAIADVYATQDQWQDARKVLQAALERSPSSRRLHFELGVAEARCGDYVSALAHFERSSGTAQAHYNLGVLLHEAGLEDASRYAFRQALEHDPKLSEAREWLIYLDQAETRSADRSGPILSDEDIRSLLGNPQGVQPAAALQPTTSSYGVEIRPTR